MNLLMLSLLVDTRNAGRIGVAWEGRLPEDEALATMDAFVKAAGSRIPELIDAQFSLFVRDAVTNPDVLPWDFTITGLTTYDSVFIREVIDASFAKMIRQRTGAQCSGQDLIDLSLKA